MNRFIYIFLLVVLAFLSTFARLNGQVVINEFSCSNMSNYVDNYGEYEDWIEFFNSGSTTATLTGFYLSDQDDNPTKWQFPATTIPAGGFIVVHASGRDEVSGGNYIHTNFKLTQTKPEHVVFSNPSGTLLESYETVPTQLGHSRGRTTNGGSTWAIFTTPTPNASNTGTSYTDYVPKPVLSLGAGFYSGTQTVTIACSDPNAEIRYTTNGYPPTATSTLYTGPVTITATTVLRAKAFTTNTSYLNSFIESNTYFIDVSHTVAVVSVFSDKVINLLNGGYISPETSLEYFDKDLQFRTEGDGYTNKHGNDSWAYAQRGIDFITRDQLGYNYALKHQIFARTPRDRFQRVILKAAANDNYPFCTIGPGVNGSAHIRDAYCHTLSQDGHLALDERTYEPCVLYANGQYWGVYELREKVDDADFIEEYYNQGEFDIQMIKTWGGTWSEFGGPQSQTDWNTFLNFVTTNDMSIPANYNIVKNQYSVNSLVDYFVLNSYVVCSDWLNWNTQWWRGMDPNGEGLKWKYCLWDEDATFGHYINYTGVPNITPTADPCNPEAFPNPGGQGHVVILNALMNNNEFWQYYVARFADLANTTFKCEHMQSMLDSMIALIAPEMPAHIAKWGGTMPQWQANVQALKNYIDQRCAELSAGMIDCYDLTGPYDITVKAEPTGSGIVVINSVTLYPYQQPWTCQYYGNMETLLKASPTSALYEFDYWELTNPVLPNANADTASTTFTVSQTVIAHFKNTMPILELGNDTSICAGASVVLDAGNPNCSFTWQNGSHNQTLIATAAGTYWVQVVSPSGYTASDTIHITVIQYPYVNLGPDTSICPGESVHLDAETYANSYIWQDNSTKSYYDVITPGTYWVKATNECGFSRDTIIVGEGVLPYVELGENQSLTYGEVIFLNAWYPFSTFLWQDLSTDPVYQVTKPGLYWVIVTNSCGFSYDNVEITLDDYDIYVPNAFTPDGDGLNDKFRIYRSVDIEADFEIIIYDRWGGIVFQSNDINFSWDGNVKENETIKSGVYSYLIKYKDITGKSISRTGLVTVVK